MQKLKPLACKDRREKIKYAKQLIKHVLTKQYKAMVLNGKYNYSSNETIQMTHINYDVSPYCELLKIRKMLNKRHHTICLRQVQLIILKLERLKLLQL